MPPSPEIVEIEAEDPPPTIYSSDDSRSDDIEAVPVLRQRASNQRATRCGIDGKQLCVLLRLGLEIAFSLSSKAFSPFSVTPPF